MGCPLLAGHRAQAAEAADAQILGVVRQTEIRIAPETSGRLAAFRVAAGQAVRKGDVLAVLSSPELTAALEEAKANAASARADRTNVLAGVRQEEVEIAAENVRIAESNLTLAQQQHTRAATLASRDVASKQQLDEATTALSKAEANLSLARATYAESKAGPTKEERDIAEAKVALAEATVADLEAQLAKTTLVAPVDGVVGLLVAELGEAITPGQPVMTLEAGHERWFTFTVREDRLSGVGIGSPVTLLTPKGEHVEARVTELRPLGEFAVWRAARAVGDHDINSFLIRADPTGDGAAGLEPGMSVWIDRAGGSRQ
jgi:HlyD family secretion protein